MKSYRFYAKNDMSKFFQCYMITDCIISALVLLNLSNYLRKCNEMQEKRCILYLFVQLVL